MFDFKVLEQATQLLGVLKKAPVREAVVACNYQAQTESQQKALHEAGKASFPEFIWTEQQKVSVDVQLSAIGGEPSALANTSQSGSRHVGKQEGSPLTLILDNSQLAVSMLTPYTHWEDFSRQAIAFGRRLAERSNTELIGYGLRYVNQINFEITLAEYLRDEVCFKYPNDQVPLFRQQQRSEFMVPDSFYAGSLSWFFEPINLQPRVTGNLMLDIDVGIFDLDQGKAYLNEQLGHMRLLKNYFFYHTVSDKVLNLCR